MTDVMERTKQVRIGQQGRMVIPASLRKSIGVEPGDTLVAWVEEDQIVLKSRRTIERELKDMFRNVRGSLAEELIQERRAEAAREAAE